MVIAVVTPSYPHTHNPAEYAFVKELVDSFARQGHECYVISPYNILHHKINVKTEYSYFVEGNEIKCYRPYFLSFSNKIKFLYYLGRKIVNYVAYVSLKKIGKKPDVIYGHFWDGAFMGYRYAVETKTPLFVASGESVIRFDRNKRTAAFCDYISGVICVSSKNKQESIERNLTSEAKCIVLPNAVNTDVFHPLDRGACRKALGYQEKDFIVAFVGYFGERKGALRVAEAIDKVGGVKSIFIGKGPQNPICKGILYKGTVLHEQLPLYLSAADVFVLPTLHEGCCNAIVEAMACGLPIVSSERSFNHDILNTSNSIMVEPMDILSIANAISFLKCDEVKRQSLSEGSLNIAKELDIDVRSRRIMEFIMNIIYK